MEGYGNCYAIHLKIITEIMVITIHSSLPMEILLPDQTTGELIILCRGHRN